MGESKIIPFPRQVRELGEDDAAVELSLGAYLAAFRQTLAAAVADGVVTPKEQQGMNHLFAKIEERQGKSLALTQRINAEIGAAALGLDPESDEAKRRLVALRQPMEDLVA